MSVSTKNTWERQRKTLPCLAGAHYTPNGLFVSLIGNQGCTVGHTETGKAGFGPSCERLGKEDLYGSVSDGREASPLDEPRTPCIECRGVSEPMDDEGYHSLLRYSIQQGKLSQHLTISPCGLSSGKCLIMCRPDVTWTCIATGLTPGNLCAALVVY